MLRKIYVGNLPYRVTEAQINEIFTPYGPVEAIEMVTYRDTGRFRGFCFVIMEETAAIAAINGLQDTRLDGRLLCIEKARSDGESGSKRRDNNRSRDDQAQGGRRRW